MTENHGVTHWYMFFIHALLCVIIGQKCNLLFISCKLIFNYTYITVHKSMSKLLCNSLWNWSWGNAHIHSWVEGIPASTLAESWLWSICTLTPYLPFLSCLWNWHAVFWYVIYHDISSCLAEYDHFDWKQKYLL